MSEYLLREGGAISKCYNVITAPSNQILQDTTIFTDEDFNVSKIIRAVMKQGDPQASLFASSLKGDDFEITKLINYLNGFTREVIQRCADISSENAETIFAQLRRDLKKQGKNLTIFTRILPVLLVSTRNLLQHFLMSMAATTRICAALLLSLALLTTITMRSEVISKTV